jgi:hypothetical protein
MPEHIVDKVENALSKNMSLGRATFQAHFRHILGPEKS